jgi:hypothetical protein
MSAQYDPFSPAFLREHSASASSFVAWIEMLSTCVPILATIHVFFGKNRNSISNPRSDRCELGCAEIQATS